MTAAIAKLIGSITRDTRGWDRGAMAVEFALAAPVLVMLVLGIADYGSLMNKSASLRGATRAGAEYAKANWNNPSISATDLTTNTESQVCGFLGLTLSGSSCSPVTPDVSSVCTCSDGTPVTCPLPTDSNPCTANSDPRVLLYVTVTATQSFSPMFSWTRFGFPATVNAATTVRTQ